MLAMMMMMMMMMIMGLGFRVYDHDDDDDDDANAFVVIRKRSTVALLPLKALLDLLQMKLPLLLSARMTL